ncbi:MAG: response regulator transcription factor [Bryobacteraceae bacterium]
MRVRIRIEDRLRALRNGHSALSEGGPRPVEPVLAPAPFQPLAVDPILHSVLRLNEATARAAGSNGSGAAVQPARKAIQPAPAATPAARPVVAPATRPVATPAVAPAKPAAPKTPLPPAVVLRDVRKELIALLDSAPASSESFPASTLVGELLKGKRVALVGFDVREGLDIRDALELHGALAAAVVPAASHLSLIRGAFDLLMWRVEDGPSLPGQSLMERIVRLAVPTLWIGKRDLVPVPPELPGGRWDFIEFIQPVDEALWRAALLLGHGLVLDGCGGWRKRAEPATVLVLDDDPFCRSLIRNALAQQGMQCWQMEEGVAPIEHIRNTRPHVVILEVSTPTVDGFQVLQAVREDPALAATRLVVLTSLHGEPEVLRAFNLGADDYVTKPFSPLELTARIKRLIDRP